MPSFHKRPVKLQQSFFQRFSIRFLILIALLLTLAFPVIKGVVGSFLNGKPFSPKQIAISSVSEAPERDAYGHTNIFVVGVGGEGHSGENLTDTMMVVSLDLKGKNAAFLSIPRDLYVESDAVGWGGRINNVYDAVLKNTESKDLAMEALITEVEKVADVPIHYYAKIDFQGFVEAIDALGGIDVDVKERIYDAEYPAPDGSGRTFEPFSLEIGPQHLDGETALKYARSRHGNSDFSRALRQQEIISAAKKKALSLGVLLNPNKLRNVYDTISANFETDLEFGEMMYLAGKADAFNEGAIRSSVLNDDPTQKGGFLYPAERVEPTDPFFLLPFDKTFEQIHAFTKIFFYHPELYSSGFQIQVLNGTKVPNLAFYGMNYLERLGLDVVRYGNASKKGVLNTSLFVQQEEMKQQEEALKALSDVVLGEYLEETPGDYLPEVWPTEANVIIELGEDFGEFYTSHPKWF